jgi:hypothetical protein
MGECSRWGWMELSAMDCTSVVKGEYPLWPIPPGCERHERQDQRGLLCAVRAHGGGGVGVSAGKRCTIAS